MLEDKLRACAIQYGTSWDKCLSYAEFSYNNSYQASLKKSPFEALYGRKCRTPLYWDQIGEKQLFGPDCNTRFIKGHKLSNHIRAGIKSHVYTTGWTIYHSTYHVKRYNKANTKVIYYNNDKMSDIEYAEA